MIANNLQKIEQFLNSGWPALESLDYDGWSLRLSEGLTKRANSISVSDNKNLHLDLKIKYCESLYSSKHLPTIFKVLSYYDNIDNELEARGYVKKDESIVMELDVSRFDKKTMDGVILEYGFQSQWIENFIKNVSNSKRFDGTYRKIFDKIEGDIICASIEVDKKIIAFGYGYCKDQMLGIFDVYVSVEERGKGYGRKIVEAIITYSIDRAKKAYLQVVKDNDVAINLYKDLGFHEIYSYWYRINKGAYE